MVLVIATYNLSLAIIPFLISLFIGLFAAFATIKRENHFFMIDVDKIEFKNGVLKPKDHTFLWRNISEIHMPQRQKKALLYFKDGSMFEINLMWIEKKKAINISLKKV